jgi:hypothetical protein
MVVLRELCWGWWLAAKLAGNLAAWLALTKVERWDDQKAVLSALRMVELMGLN